jgi:uncharacterized protein YidB (DUF937 family)
MGILDGVIGGLVSAGVTALINNVLEQNDGVRGLVQKFEQSGLGQIAQSWVSKGTNMDITPEEIAGVLGGSKIEELASKIGISTDELSQKLAEILPEAIDKLTPNGEIEEEQAA